MSPYRVYGLDDAELWRRHVPVSSETDVYFSAGYHVAFREHEEGEPRLFVYEEEGHRARFPFFVRPVPRSDYRDVSSVYGYGGFLLPRERRDDEGYARRFLAALDEHYRRERVVAEFVRFHPLLETHRFAPVKPGYVQPTVAVDTTADAETIWSGYSGSNRRAIRKAIEAGLDVEIRDDAADLPVFVELYTDTMERVGAAPYYFFTESFFRTHFERLPGHVHLATVRSAGRVVAGALLLSWNGYLHYHLGGSAADALEFRPNNLLFHRVIEWARDRGLAAFHLGGGVEGEDSLYRFKRGFARDGSRPFFVGRRVVDPEAYGELVERWRARLPEGAAVDEDYFPLYRASVPDDA